jgi:predicted RecB family endonuclease
VVHSIGGRNRAKCEDIYAFKAGYVVTKDTWIRPTLVMCVDATDSAEIVLGDLGVELIEAKELSAMNDMKPVHGDR